MPTDLAAQLVEDGLVPAEQVARALARQRAVGGALDTALLELGLLDEPALLAALSRASGLPAAPASAWSAADARARRVFPSRVAERHGLAPFALSGRELSLVSAFPIDGVLLDEISFMLSLHLTPHVAPEWRVRALVHQLYGGPLEPRFAALAAGNGKLLEPLPADAVEAPPPAPASPPAPREPEPVHDPHALAPPPEPEAAADDPSFGPALEEPAALDLAPAPRLEPGGFSRAAGEPLEPLAEALAQALESDELSFLDVPDEPVAAGAGGEAQPAPAAAPAAESAAPAAPAMALGPPGWSLEEARAALAAASRRDAVVRVLLRATRDVCEFVALFAVTRDAVAGHDALGMEEDARDRCRGTAIYVSDPGTLRTVIETRAPYLGPMDRGLAGNQAILDGLGRGTPRAVLVAPVLLRNRVACLLYADNGQGHLPPRRLESLLVLVSAVGPAFERLIRQRKERVARRAAADASPDPWRAVPLADAVIGAPPAAPSAQAPPAAPSAQAPPAAPEAKPETVASAAKPETAPAPEAGAAPAAVTDEFDIDLELDASDLTEVEAPLAPGASPLDSALAALLASAPGSAERAAALASVAAEPDAAEALAARLPGPVEADEGPAPAAYGPVPAALAALGAQAVPSLLPVLQDADSTRRRLAAVLLGAAGDPAALPALPALGDRALDPDARVAAAAAAALARFRRAPALRPVVEKLRRVLLSGVAARATAAARALEALRDVEAIPLLIQVVEAGDPASAGAAADALGRITLQRIGVDPRGWLAWWKTNRGRGRAEWLFAGLLHADPSVREAAAAELSAAAPPPVSYAADGPVEEREAAARAWASWWARSGQVL